MDMMQKCDKLKLELERLTHQDRPCPFDMLCEYRNWLDSGGIMSESENGWPLPFVFEYKNIHKFVEYWNGD